MLSPSSQQMCCFILQRISIYHIPFCTLVPLPRKTIINTGDILYFPVCHTLFVISQCAQTTAQTIIVWVASEQKKWTSHSYEGCKWKPKVLTEVLSGQVYSNGCINIQYFYAGDKFPNTAEIFSYQEKLFARIHIQLKSTLFLCVSHCLSTMCDSQMCSLENHC